MDLESQTQTTLTPKPKKQKDLQQAQTVDSSVFFNSTVEDIEKKIQLATITPKTQPPAKKKNAGAVGKKEPTKTEEKVF